jgi:hypothetical protein
MLAKRHQTVHLSFISTDLPFWNTIEAKALLFQNDRERFHLLLNQQNLPQSIVAEAEPDKLQQGIFWLDISPYQVSMTMQSNGRLSYRHFWQRGIYGVSRYCLNSELNSESNFSSQSLVLRNFTHSLEVNSDPLPRIVRIEYEIWSAQLNLGSYILHLEIN